MHKFTGPARRKLTLLLIAALAGLSLSGCGLIGQATAELVPYEHDSAGYRLALPGDWQEISADAETNIWAATDNSLTLTLANELGGEAYYTLGEISDMLLENLPNQEAGWTLDRTIVNKQDESRRLYSGSDAEGAGLYLDIYLVQPYAGFRYYLLFAGAGDQYTNQRSLINSIIDSFQVTDDLVYLYAEMNARHEAAAEEAEAAIDRADDPAAEPPSAEPNPAAPAD